MSHENLKKDSLKLPNLLTFYRILVVVPFIGLFFIQARWANWVAVILFVSACITDFFDGYVARLQHQTTELGTLLDPIADKILVATSLLMLAGTGRIAALTLLPACVILAREIIVSGLREFLAEISIKLPVSKLAKWKTGVQMVALACLLFDDPRKEIWLWGELGESLLWIAAFLTLMSGADYWKAGWAYLNKKTSSR